MSDAVISRWRDGSLQALDEPVDLDGDGGPGASRLAAADSWLVADGAALALQLHRDRFLSAIADDPAFAALDPEAFVAAAVAAIPREGAWFPRLDARWTTGAADAGDAGDDVGTAELLLRLRPAPERRRAIRLATHLGRDPRTRPRIKGPDLAAMGRLRAAAGERGADEAVLLTSDDGAVAEGSTSCLVWWRGDALCLPEEAIDRVDSVTVRSILALATALGVDVLHERATLQDLDGLEVWALNALHGIRIVTDWIDGPETAELPGRLDLWRRRLEALRRPLPIDEPASA